MKYLKILLLFTLLLSVIVIQNDNMVFAAVGEEGCPDDPEKLARCYGYLAGGEFVEVECRTAYYPKACYAL